MTSPKEKQTFYSLVINEGEHDVTGRKRSPRGYVLLCIKSHPKSDVLGYVFEHRVMMELKIGRYLKTGEVVHHKNEVKHDNRLSNLGLMSHGTHTTLHHTGSKRSEEVRIKMSKVARKRNSTPHITKFELENQIKSNKKLKEVFKQLGIAQVTYYKLVNEFNLQEVHSEFRGRNYVK